MKNRSTKYLKDTNNKLIGTQHGNNMDIWICEDIVLFIVSEIAQYFGYRYTVLCR